MYTLGRHCLLAHIDLKSDVNCPYLSDYPQQCKNQVIFFMVSSFLGIFEKQALAYSFQGLNELQVR
jgi:hypothetical protein